MEKVNALVVDDAKLFAESFAHLLTGSMYVAKAWEAITAEQGISIIRKYSIQVAFIDARMPVTDGIQLILRLRKDFPRIYLIGMTGYNEASTLADLKHAGVHGILLKHHTGIEEINQCLKTILHGKYYSNSSLADVNFDARPTLNLTARDFDVLRLLCEGLATKEIAATLGLQQSSIEDHRKRLLHKTGTKNSTELIAYVLRNGLL
ncbi:MAG: response regulator [Cyclobacteriaceae bacterium]|jgi:DNA-binding NarL/FixJ family response regulator